MPPRRKRDHADPIFFTSAAEFRRWLARHHASARELWVGFHKKGTGRPTLTWPESVDEALCYGWIDGVRRSVDHERYVIRFSPRQPRSIWSDVNTRRAEELLRAGRMRKAGREAFAARDAARSGVYSFEQRRHATLDPDQEARFRADAQAWDFFTSQPPGYRRTATWYVVSAKQKATQARRLEILIADSRAGRRIGLLRRDQDRTGNGD